MNGDDVEFGGTPDVFAEVESDPLDEDTTSVEEAELPGDNPSTADFLEEPEETEPEPSAEPVEAELPGEAEALAAAAEADPAEPQPDPAPEPTPEPAAAEPEPAAPAAPAEPAKPKAEKKPQKKTKKALKKAEAKRPSNRGYIVLYAIEGGYAVGPEVEARSVKVALEEAFSILSKETKQTEFASMVAIPVTNWKPEPVSGKQEVKDVVSIG